MLVASPTGISVYFGTKKLSVLSPNGGALAKKSSPLSSPKPDGGGVNDAKEEPDDGDCNDNIEVGLNKDGDGSDDGAGTDNDDGRDGVSSLSSSLSSPFLPRPLRPLLVAAGMVGAMDSFWMGCACSLGSTTTSLRITTVIFFLQDIALVMVMMGTG